MNIQHDHNESEGRFFVEKEGQTIAEMVYMMTGPKNLTILHTEVDPSLEGKGVGKTLLQHLVEYVRQEHIKVYPQCPFANAVFKRVKEWQDVLVE